MLRGGEEGGEVSWRKRFVQPEGFLTCTGHPQMVCMVSRVGRKDQPRLDKAILNVDSFSKAQRYFKRPGKVARLLTAWFVIRTIFKAAFGVVLVPVGEGGGGRREGETVSSMDRLTAKSTPTT